MSRLSDVVAKVIEVETDLGGRLNIHRAVATAMSMIDDEDREILLREALGKRVKDKATKSSKALAASLVPAQHHLPFPNLRPRYTIDADEREVVLTTEMSEMEFRRVIEIRRNQLAADAAHLHELEFAYGSVQPFWRKHPDYTFGQVCRLYEAAAPEVATS